MAAIPTALNFNNSSVLMYGELLPSWKNPFKYYFGNVNVCVCSIKIDNESGFYYMICTALISGTQIKYEQYGS